MGATAKYRPGRRTWICWLHQFDDRWSVSRNPATERAWKNEAEVRAFERECNRRMEAGEDLRPPHVLARSKSQRASSGAPAASTAAGDSLTFRAFAERWLVEDWPHRKATTNAHYLWSLKHYLIPALGDVPLAMPPAPSITRDDCRRAIGNLRNIRSKRTGRPLSRKTREGIHHALTAVLTAALEQDIIAANPAFEFAKWLEKPDEVQREVVPWTREESDRVLTVVKKKWREYYAFFLVALRCGLRIGEIVELRWASDFQHPGMIYVQRAYSTRRRTTVTVTDKGFECDRIADHDGVGSTKGKRTRLVDASPDVLAALEEHKALMRKQNFRRGGRGLPALTFVGPKGARLSAGNLAKRLLPEIIKAAKVKRITIHGLRHTYATTLLAAGEDIGYVSRQMGHRDEQTTLTIYKHWLPDTERDAERRARLDRIWAVPKAKPAAAEKEQKGKA